jgi:hypothetical protein
MLIKNAANLTQRVLFAAMVAFVGSPVLADPLNPQAFEAVSENVKSGGTTHIWSDGKGHTRAETAVRGVNYVSITDFKNKISYSINEATKTITKVPLVGTPGEDPTAQWAPCGEKDIDGHHCKGRRGTKGGAVMEVWTGTDTDCTVLATTDGVPIHKLKSWKKASPAASMFELPQGYKTVDMSALMEQMRHPSH